MIISKDKKTIVVFEETYSPLGDIKKIKINFFET